MKKKEPSEGSALAKKRWAKTSAAKRREIAMKMVEAKRKKRLAQNKNGPSGPKEEK